jgi:hypothetical protein
MSTLYPDAPQSRFLELTNEEWALLGLGATAVVAAVAAMRGDMTLWPAMAIFFTATTVGHLCLTARRYVAFPDLIASAACLQYVIVPWLSELYPPSMPTFRMAVPSTEYLQYALPATVALWLGLHLPVSRRLSKTWAVPEVEHLSKPVRHTLDGIIIVGLLVDMFVPEVASVQWAFLVYLVSSFRFVGALGWMVTRTPGWPWRVAIVLIHLMAVESTGGLFYLVVHWGGYFLLVYAFMKRWRWQMAVALVVGMMGLSLLQSVKPTFRTSLTEKQVSGPTESITRLTGLLWDKLKTGEIVDTDTDINDSLVRFNQGWIIARVMTRVPVQEPYARGQTLYDAVVFSIIPRFLFPEKKEGASRSLFMQYTGIELGGGTRMGLGIVGEFYANFGLRGGVIATFLYGCLIGFVFLQFADRAQKNPLWWAVASTVLLPSVEPGFNVEDILNHVTKAAVVLLVMWKLIPPMQRLLSTTRSVAPDNDQAADGSPSLDDAVVER